MTVEERIRELHKKTVTELVEAHRQRTDEPMVLAIQYRLDDPADVYLLEVLQGFPGGADDELMTTTFEPSAQLRLLGRLHLALGSPDQLRAAITRQDEQVVELRHGRLLADDGSEEAKGLIGALGL